MSPKNLLRHKDCKSNLSEFDDVQGHPGFDKQGTRFKRLIKDQNDHSDREEGIRRLVLCSGKVWSCTLLSLVTALLIWTFILHSIEYLLTLQFVIAVSYYCFQIYYELDEERKKVEGKDIAICRVEQLCPFPYDLIQRELKRYPSMSQMCLSILILKWLCLIKFDLPLIIPIVYTLIWLEIQ